MAVCYRGFLLRQMHRCLIFTQLMRILSKLLTISTPKRHTFAMGSRFPCCNFVQRELPILSVSFLISVSPTGVFPDSWKYANVQPIHKKDNRQRVNNYRPISLLSICGKILEKIVFDKVYAFFNKNNLISSNQSGFRPGDSTIYQLLSITLLFRKSLKNTMKRAHFFLIFPKPLIRCGMMESFDKVWYDGVI